MRTVQNASAGTWAGYDVIPILVDTDPQAGDASQQIGELKIAFRGYMFACQKVPDAMLRSLCKSDSIE